MIRLFFFAKLPILVERGNKTKKEKIFEGGIRMKKVLCTIALMLLVAGSAYAQATFSMTGSYWAEGKYWFNFNPDPDQEANYKDTSFGFYEQDINLFPKISVGNTSLNFRLAITDVNWGDSGPDSLDDSLDDDNFLVERAFITHKFNDVFTLDVGLMDGTQWGTTFADDKQGRWRVKLTANTSVGVVGGVLEKVWERGAVGENARDEGDDVDHYGLFAVTKVGSVYVKPLIFYIDNRNANGHDNDVTMLNLVLAFNGDLGPLSFEAELNSKQFDADFSTPDLDEDWWLYGIYFNVWKELDTMTPGLLFAYASYDDEGGPAKTGAGFGYEDDFDATVILDDQYAWGNAGGDGMVGMTTLKLYVNDIKTGIDPLTLSAYFAYVMSNQEDSTVIVGGNPVRIQNNFEDATAWEAALGASYRITDNLIYSVYGAYADINYDADNIDDPDAVYLIANAIEFNF